MSRERILHVSNRWGGGVKTAVQQYVAALPDHTHFLLRGDDPWAVQGRDARVFADVCELPPSSVAAITAMRNAIERYDVGVVHAHSSFAGAVARFAPRDIRVVYTPHAYATLAPRGSRVWLAGQIEWLLGTRPITVAAVGDAEAALARRYSPRSSVVRIINLPHPTLLPEASFASPLRVTSVGRICRQKGVDFFADAVRRMRAVDPDLSAEWIGDGDAAMCAALARVGVSVTGWLPMTEVHSRMATCGVYLHAAAYEGACLSVLDAAALGLPSIGRPVPGVAEVSWMTLAATPQQAADAVLDLRDRATWEAVHAKTLADRAELTEPAQRRQLLLAYGLEGADSVDEREDPGIAG